MAISPINTAGYSTAVSADLAPAPQSTVAAATAQSSSTVELGSQAVQPTASPLTHQQVKDAVDRANKAVQAITKNVEFSVDHDTGIYLIKVVDTQTKDVIRQIPSEEIIDLAKALDKVQGLIIRQKA